MPQLSLRSTKAEIWSTLRSVREEVLGLKEEGARLRRLGVENERIRKDIVAERDATVHDLRDQVCSWKQRALDLSSDRLAELVDARKEIHRLGGALEAAGRREGLAMAKVTQLMYRPSILRRLMSRLTNW